MKRKLYQSSNGPYTSISASSGSRQPYNRRRLRSTRLGSAPSLKWTLTCHCQCITRVYRWVPSRAVQFSDSEEEEESSS